MPYLLALLCGIALALSQPPSRRHWLQLVAFAPLLWALEQTLSLGASAVLGAIFGASYALVTLLSLKLPPIISTVLAVSQTLTWVLFAAFCFAIQDLPPLPNALAIGAGATFLVWLETQILPLWGSAQSFARGWSHQPRLVQWVCFTGAPGVVWVLLTLQALAVAALQTPSLWFTLALTIITLGIVSEWLWRRRFGATMRVATIGWANIGADDVSLDKLEPHIARLAGEGARMVVAPEAAFRVANRRQWRAQIGALAARHQVWLALGYFDDERHINCIDWVAPDGEVRARYLKTHLVPVYETYTRGSGARAEVEVDGARIGGLICQDDNFSDIARGYGRDGAQLLTIPTNDWRGVQWFHLTSTLWRALELRVPIARATSAGVSVIVSARGEVLKRAAHFDEGFQTLICDVPLGSGRPTLYARRGDWFALACGIGALAATLYPT